MIDIILKVFVVWFAFVLVALAFAWVKDIFINRPHPKKRGREHRMG